MVLTIGIPLLGHEYINKQFMCLSLCAYSAMNKNSFIRRKDESKDIQWENHRIIHLIFMSLIIVSDDTKHHMTL